MKARSKREPTDARNPVRSKLYGGAAALAFSVVADSSVEHYRGGFHNRVMYVAPAVSSLTLLAALRSLKRQGSPSYSRRALFTGAAAAGVVGTGFHIYNVSRREGGFRWLNLFYGAPLAAPLGITFAGLFGLSGDAIAIRDGESRRQGLLGRPAGPLIGAAAMAGLLGTSAEAGLLHFRGSFQDPFMYIPVTVPPLAAISLAGALASRRPAGRRVARGLLWSTAAAGFIGMGFHAYGIHRNMGGWQNWSQMLQQGPPLPAPPSFTGMALAGLAALDLMQSTDDD